MKKLIIFFILLLFVTPAQAKNKKNKGSESQVQTVRDVVEKPFGFLPPPPPLPGMSRDSAQEIIDRYYRNTEREREQYRHYEDDARDNYSHKKGKKKKHMPAGLKKKAARGKELPPGWRKKIARGQVLDRDLREHCQEIPPELYSALPRPPRGTKYLQIEDDILRVMESTFEIIDVFTHRR